jgi:hypothetical protein
MSMGTVRYNKEDEPYFYVVAMLMQLKDQIDELEQQTAEEGLSYRTYTSVVSLRKALENVEEALAPRT